MEPIFDNRDEDTERLERRLQRLERMRREKQRQEEKRRMIKRLLPLGTGAVALVIILVVAIVSLLRKPEANETQMQAQIETPVEQSVEVITEEEASEEEISTAEEVPINYEFVSTSETATIYSEEVISSHAILVDESTDTIVASKGDKERISPASMTKVLTVLVAAEQITEAQLDDMFTMTLEITDYAYVNDCSSVGFLDGEKVTVRDLFYGTVLPSGGDAAVGLATYIAGSHEAFVDLMNEKLDELGLSGSAHFTNCVGLYDENHYCTVYDMAVIMKAAMHNDMCREFLSAHSYTTAPTTEHPKGITISNWFLRRIEDKETGGEVIGGKTGYVVQSKSCAVSYGTFAGGTPYICVTAGSSSSWQCIYDQVEIYNRYVPDVG
ncbi:MAG: serine hydrolase [Lachnospiraceae bacterium]|nr:serine hydrolase [Lachnospiraceae bacterium]MBQ6995015.1 serine hydrolase [Lachnospiraceae bacterium]